MTKAWWIVILTLAYIICLIATSPMFGHDAADPELDVWYASLRQPDAPTISCCGKADSYFCDDVWSEGELTFCRITDTRDDKPLGRPHIDAGTIIPIPPNKFGPGKWGNPTGHTVVFLSYTRIVYCFIQGGGV